MAFWEVINLHRLKPADQVALKHFENNKGQEPYASDAPDRPTLANLKG